MQKLPLFWFILIAVLFSAKTMGNKITSIDDIPMELRKAYQQYHSILSELKHKADEQTSEKRAERFMRFHDQYNLELSEKWSIELDIEAFSKDLIAKF